MFALNIFDAIFLETREMIYDEKLPLFPPQFITCVSGLDPQSEKIFDALRNAVYEKPKEVPALVKKLQEEILQSPFPDMTLSVALSKYLLTAALDAPLEVWKELLPLLPESRNLLWDKPSSASFSAEMLVLHDRADVLALLTETEDVNQPLCDRLPNLVALAIHECKSNVLRYFADRFRGGQIRICEKLYEFWDLPQPGGGPCGHATAEDLYCRRLAAPLLTPLDWDDRDPQPMLPGMKAHHCRSADTLRQVLQAGDLRPQEAGRCLALFAREHREGCAALLLEAFPRLVKSDTGRSAVVELYLFNRKKWRPYVEQLTPGEVLLDRVTPLRTWMHSTDPDVLFVWRNAPLLKGLQPTIDLGVRWKKAELTDFSPEDWESIMTHCAFRKQGASLQLGAFTCDFLRHAPLTLLRKQCRRKGFLQWEPRHALWEAIDAPSFPEDRRYILRLSMAGEQDEVL